MRPAARAEGRWQDLHEAREHHNVATMLPEEVEHALERRAAGFAAGAGARHGWRLSGNAVLWLSESA